MHQYKRINDPEIELQMKLSKRRLPFNERVLYTFEIVRHRIDEAIRLLDFTLSNA